MTNYVGLYYPSIGFKDDAWVKLAALYWDKLGRIVPYGCQVKDSDTVKQLTEELGFIQNFAPSDEDMRVIGRKFSKMLLKHGKKKVTELLRVNPEFEVSDTSITVAFGILPMASNYLWLPNWDQNEFESFDLKHTSFIAAGKMYVSLLKLLVDAGLAFILKGGLPLELVSPSFEDDSLDDSLVGMHPTLAYIYMEALAEQMAQTRHLCPVTDSIFDHVVIKGASMERLTQALLLPENQQLEASPMSDEIVVQMATIALRSVLPRDIAHIPTKKIVKLRQQHRDEMTAFQVYLNDLAADLESFKAFSDPAALKAHLEVEYEKKLKPQLEDLKKCFRSLGADTVMGTLNIRVAIPPLVASASSYLHLASINPIVVGTGAIAFSIVPVIQEKQKEIKQVIRSSPAAYLLYAQEDLEPFTLVSQIIQRTRQLLFRV